MTGPIRIVAGGPAEPYRERTSVRAGHVWSYRPAHVQRYQAHLRLAVDEAMDGRAPIEGAVRVGIDVYLPMPRAMPKYKRVMAEAGTLRPTTRPDLTQYIKAIEDALNGRAIHDDSQVTVMLARKLYSSRPRIEITVTEDNDG